MKFNRPNRRWTTAPLAIVITLLISAHRLPAPITEVQETPAPSAAAPSPAKAKPAPRAKDSTDTSRDSLRKFDGTWSGNTTVNSAHHTNVYQILMIIRESERVASGTTTLTQTLVPGQVWANLPENYQALSPIVLKYAHSSHDLRVDGSNLRVRWPASELLDWSPKTIPFAIIQPLATDPARMSVYTLHNNQLTREFDSNGGMTYTRVK